MARSRAPRAASAAASLAALALAATAAFWGVPAWAAPAPARPPAAPSAGETTTDPSALRLARDILTVRLEKGKYEIMEMLEFENGGKATIVSRGGAPTLRIPLPRSSNVRNPQAEWAGAPVGLDPKFLQLMGSQVISTEPIPPGRKMVVVLYRLADEFGGITVDKPILYGTNSFAVLPEKGRVQMSAGGGLVPQEAVTFQNRVYDRFVGSVRPGTMLRLNMKAPDSMGALSVFYVAGGAVIVAGAVVGLWLRRRRGGALARQVEREALLRGIAALDDRLARGEITEEAHARERGPRFARLREISR